MLRPGPKQLARTVKALQYHASGMSAVDAAHKAGVNPSTLYRALQRRRKK